MCSLPTLKTLEVNFSSYKDVPVVTKNLFQNCNQVEEVTLVFDKHNGPDQMDQNVLEGFSNVDQLHIIGYNIDHFHKLSWKTSTSPTELSLLSCNIHEIDSGALEDLENLKVLSIGDNRQLTKLPRGLFKNTPKLHTLNLRRNAIEDLTWEEFEDLTNLEDLDIGENRISVFDVEKIATNLPNLKKLSIDGNPQPCKQKEDFVNELKSKLKKVEVEYKCGPGY